MIIINTKGQTLKTLIKSFNISLALSSIHSFIDIFPTKGIFHDINLIFISILGFDPKTIFDEMNS